MKYLIKEEATYTENIDYRNIIKDLTKFLLKKYPDINQIPKVKFIHKDKKNASDFLGKTAYYNPNNKTIVLYTEGRHPTSILNSFTHEFIHFIQDIRGQLNDIQDSNILNSNELEIIEREAYEEGGILLRSYKDYIRNQKNPKWKDFLLNNIQESFTKYLKENKGYRAGTIRPEKPAETLKDRGIGIVNSTIGLLGSGYYFLGTKEDALELKDSSGGYSTVTEIDLESYNLFKPKHPEAFYENIKYFTHFLHGLSKEEINTKENREFIEDGIKSFSEYLNINKNKTKTIIYKYIYDVINNKDGDLLSNRLLYMYDGIDMRGTSLDNFGVGSLIFNKKLKPDTYKSTNIKTNE